MRSSALTTRFIKKFLNWKYLPKSVKIKGETDNKSRKSEGIRNLLTPTALKRVKLSKNRVPPSSSE